ncbi:MAG: hypothetical protein KDK99_20035 [Verrucomicrobiales bacterium]|nr:hypothetical protein [Verrucomicrobiales bacterium]
MKLQAELGAAMPTGSGIALLQGEAGTVGTTPLEYLPQAGGPDLFAGVSNYAGKTFTPHSGEGIVLNHANSVASNFYGNGWGAAPGATEIHCFDANDFIDRLGSFLTAPEVFPGRVQNHSWVGSTGNSSSDAQMLRRFDFMLNRDARLAAVGLYNSPTIMQPLLGCSYHALVVGVMSGAHSQTGTTVDGTGRMKPDLVVNESLTSYATPVVAGSAAVLLQAAIASGDPDAERPEVIRAQLIAGASKQRLPAWQRAADAKPYDAVFGAGEVNIHNSWHLQAAGKQTYSTTVDRQPSGWDLAATTSNSSGRRYFFTIPEGRYADTFSVALCWNRQISTGGLSYSSSLSDLNLKLYASTGLTPEAVPLAQSISTVDNVEHLFLRNLPPGQYLLQVTASVNNRDYALAWQSLLGAGPVLTLRREASGQVFLDAAALDPFVSYQILISPDLTAPWTVKETFRTADTAPSLTHAWEDVSPAPDRSFYRLSWEAIR